MGDVIEERGQDRWGRPLMQSQWDDGRQRDTVAEVPASTEFAGSKDREQSTYVPITSVYFFL